MRWLFIEEDRVASKSPVKHSAIFCLFPSKKFLPIIQNSAVGNFSPKTEGTKTKAARCLFFMMSFPSCKFLIPCNLLLLLTFCQICLLVKETAEIETGKAEKSSREQANIRQKLGLVWRNRKKISQIITDYFFLPFFLLIILCGYSTCNNDRRTSLF